MAKGGGGEGGLYFDSSDPFRFPFIHQHHPIVINSFPDPKAPLSSSSSSGHTDSANGNHLNVIRAAHASSQKLIAAMDQRHHLFPMNLHSFSRSQEELDGSPAPSDQKAAAGGRVMDEMDFFGINSTTRASHQPHDDADQEKMSDVRSPAGLELNVNVRQYDDSGQKMDLGFIERFPVTYEKVFMDV